jgi:glycosyltransferase involved in cell wall biosynthesis
LAAVENEFDAVYNAKLMAFKRHYLAVGIGRVSYITYFDSDLPKMAARALCKQLNEAIPGHRVVNPIENGLPKFIEPAEVNRAYNRAAVGLCLSAEEGAMYSSLEYMLAGLPIVSTPSKGGREVFFDPNFCVLVDPNPSAVREGVERLIARNIPRDEIRESTLAKVRVHRDRFQRHLNEILNRDACEQGALNDWSIGRPTSKKVRCHLNDLLAS